MARYTSGRRTVQSRPSSASRSSSFASAKPWRGSSASSPSTAQSVSESAGSPDVAIVSDPCHTEQRAPRRE